ncbi:mucin-2 [Patella vulgata]|uniref:mucin-2 n=1 Tax=Patella vulgata TaxID=6465 RepID=UPI00217F4B60|nr:mucin-2 [Patella vulgata]
MYSRLSNTMTPAQKLELLKKEMIRLATEKETPQTKNRNIEIENEFSKLRQGILDLGNALSVTENSSTKTAQAGSGSKPVVVTPRRIVKAKTNKSPVAPAFSPTRFVRRFGEPEEDEKPKILTPTARTIMARMEAKKAEKNPAKQTKVSTFLERKNVSPNLTRMDMPSDVALLNSNENTSKTRVTVTEQTTFTNFETRQDYSQSSSSFKTNIHSPSLSNVEMKSDRLKTEKLTPAARAIRDKMEAKADAKKKSPSLPTTPTTSRKDLGTSEVMTPTARATKATLEAEKREQMKRDEDKKKRQEKSQSPVKIIQVQSPKHEDPGTSEVLTPTARAMKATLEAKKSEQMKRDEDKKKRQKKSSSPVKIIRVQSPKQEGPQVLTPTMRAIQETMEAKKRKEKSSSPVKIIQVQSPKHEGSQVLTPAMRALQESMEAKKEKEKSPSHVQSSKQEGSQALRPTKSALQKEKASSTVKIMQHSSPKQEENKSAQILTPTARAVQESMEAKRKESPSPKILKPTFSLTERQISPAISTPASLPETPKSKTSKILKPVKKQVEVIETTTIVTQTYSTTGSLPDTPKSASTKVKSFEALGRSLSQRSTGVSLDKSPDTPRSKAVHFAKVESISLDKPFVSDKVLTPEAVRGIIKPARLTRRALHPEAESPKPRMSRRNLVKFGENTIHSDNVTSEDDIEDDGDDDYDDNDEASAISQISESNNNNFNKVSQRGKKRQMSSSDENDSDNGDDADGNEPSTPIVSCSKRRRTYVTTPHPVKRKGQSLRATVEEEEAEKDEKEDSEEEDDNDGNDAIEVSKPTRKRAVRKSPKTTRSRRISAQTKPVCTCFNSLKKKVA